MCLCAQEASARRQVVCCSSECICMCTYSICTYSRCVCVHRKRLPVVRGRALHLSVCAHTSDTCSYDTCSYAHMHIDVDVPDGVCVSRVKVAWARRRQARAVMQSWVIAAGRCRWRCVQVTICRYVHVYMYVCVTYVCMLQC